VILILTENIDHSGDTDVAVIVRVDVTRLIGERGREVNLSKQNPSRELKLDDRGTRFDLITQLNLHLYVVNVE
jgi:hypothetical protein